MTTLKVTAPTVLATPISKPSILAVRMIARILIAGPEYKNAIAGPRPAPRLWMLENNGSIVQEHTAKMVPETAATVYASHFFALAPKYLRTEPWLTKTDITPAIKNAGSRQRITCSRAYHFIRSSVAAIAVLNRVLSIGRKKANANIAANQPSILSSFLSSMLLI